MKIIVTGNLKEAKNLPLLKKLKEAGHRISLSKSLEERLKGSGRKEKAKFLREKTQLRAIKSYFKAIEKADGLLVINDKAGKIENYIDGKTFLEMGFAHVMSKKLFLLAPIGNINFKKEVLAMKPVIIKNDFKKIIKLK